MPSPASAHGGGGTFNGGTITAPLVIALPAGATGIPLLITHGDYPGARIQANIQGSAAANPGQADVIAEGSGPGRGIFSVADADTGRGFLDSGYGVIGVPPTLAAATQAVLSATDVDGNDVFEVRKNASVHIKTGTAVIADL